MRQILILRIHTDGTLVLTKLMWSELSLENEVVAIATSKLEWLNREHTLLAILVDEDVNLLKSNSIVETLLVDNILDSVLAASLGTCCRECPIS